jgi:ankyrin repeat protein
MNIVINKNVRGSNDPKVKLLSTRVSAITTKNPNRVSIIMQHKKLVSTMDYFRFKIQLSDGQNININILHLAIMLFDIPSIVTLIKAGMSTTKIIGNKSPMLLAITQNNLIVVDILIKAGVNINELYHGITALHILVDTIDKQSNIMFYKEILKKGVDVDIKSCGQKSDLTPFQLLCRNISISVDDNYDIIYRLFDILIVMLPHVKNMDETNIYYLSMVIGTAGASGKNSEDADRLLSYIKRIIENLEKLFPDTFAIKYTYIGYNFQGTILECSILDGNTDIAKIIMDVHKYNPNVVDISPDYIAGLIAKINNKKLLKYMLHIYKISDLFSLLMQCLDNINLNIKKEADAIDLLDIVAEHYTFDGLGDQCNQLLFSCIDAWSSTTLLKLYSLGIKFKYNPCLSGDTNICSYNFKSLLMCACAFYRTDFIRYLIENGHPIPVGKIKIKTDEHEKTLSAPICLIEFINHNCIAKTFVSFKRIRDMISDHYLCALFMVHCGINDPEIYDMLNITNVQRSVINNTKKHGVYATEQQFMSAFSMYEQDSVNCLLAVRHALTILYMLSLTPVVDVSFIFEEYDLFVDVISTYDGIYDGVCMTLCKMFECRCGIILDTCVLKISNMKLRDIKIVKIVDISGMMDHAMSTINIKNIQYYIDTVDKILLHHNHVFNTKRFAKPTTRTQDDLLDALEYIYDYGRKCDLSKPSFVHNDRVRTIISKLDVEHILSTDMRSHIIDIRNKKVRSVVTKNIKNRLLFKLSWPAVLGHYSRMYNMIFNNTDTVEWDDATLFVINCGVINARVTLTGHAPPSKWFTYYGKNIGRNGKQDPLHMFSFAMDKHLQYIKCNQTTVPDPMCPGRNMIKVYYPGSLLLGNVMCRGNFEYFIGGNDTLFHRMFRPYIPHKN